MNIVGLRGYKRRGFYTGLIGTIERYSDMSFFNNLYVIRFENGAGVVTQLKDIVILEGQKVGE